MIFNYKNLMLVQICVLGLLSGCASGPETVDNTRANEFSDDSMDVLFATEFPVTSAEDAVLQADLAVKEGKTDQALFYLVRALQFREDNVDVLVRIGDIQMQRKDIVFANRAYMTAKYHDPENSRALEGLGLIYSSAGDDEEAIAHLKLAVMNDESLWRAHNALGVYADKSGDYSTAQRHYNVALAANPDAAYVLNNRGYSKYLAGDAQGAALDFYAAANDQGFVQAWANLGRIYAEEGQYDDAIKTYKLVMNEASAFNNIGSVAIENGDLVRAEHYLSEAIRLSPTYFPSAEENLSHLQQLQ
jgi:Flp pilus assembly protein TadD